jgi:hypothetical protein
MFGIKVWGALFLRNIWEQRSWRRLHWCTLPQN